MDKIHHSKVDNWLLMTVVSLALMVLLASTLLALAGLAPLGLLLFLLGAALPMWIVMATRYHIIDDELVIRAGPLRWRLPIDAIERVEACHNGAVAPAMSKQRLCLYYHLASDGAAKRAYMVYVSPEDRYQFIFDIGVADPDADEADD